MGAPAVAAEAADDLSPSLPVGTVAQALRSSAPRTPVLSPAAAAQRRSSLPLPPFGGGSRAEGDGGTHASG